MNKINRNQRCEDTIRQILAEGDRPKLLLHVCCAPCASAVIERLEVAFDLTLFFYNPNITDVAEFSYRYRELERFVAERSGADIPIIAPEYDPMEFFSISKGLEAVSEGGARCMRCFEQRLARTADAAFEGGFEYFTTTLSVSPYKNAEALCRIGAEEAARVGVKYLESDFKKKGGYLRSIELSEKYGLYRQSYCGCAYSKAQSESRRAERKIELSTHAGLNEEQNGHERRGSNGIGT